AARSYQSKAGSGHERINYRCRLPVTSGFRFPVSGFLRLPVAGCRLPVTSGFRFPVTSGFRFPVSGCRFPVSGYSVSDGAKQKKKTRGLWPRGSILDSLTATRGHPNRLLDEPCLFETFVIRWQLQGASGSLRFENPSHSEATHQPVVIVRGVSGLKVTFNLCSGFRFVKRGP
ncbi:MAG TPA: hypothetical protein VMS98_00045, partial [Thermoanaerobaculia bacterium]|nr:hypothetical protein [Thermoanaerobaculia bacterium]